MGHGHGASRSDRVHRRTNRTSRTAGSVGPPDRSARGRIPAAGSGRPGATVVVGLVGSLAGRLPAVAQLGPGDVPGARRLGGIDPPVVVLYGDSLAWEAQDHFVAAFADRPARAGRDPHVRRHRDLRLPRPDASRCPRCSRVRWWWSSAATPSRACMMDRGRPSLARRRLRRPVPPDAEAVVGIFGPMGAHAVLRRCADPTTRRRAALQRREARTRCTGRSPARTPTRPSSSTPVRPCSTTGGGPRPCRACPSEPCRGATDGSGRPVERGACPRRRPLLPGDPVRSGRRHRWRARCGRAGRSATAGPWPPRCCSPSTVARPESAPGRSTGRSSGAVVSSPQVRQVTVRPGRRRSSIGIRSTRSLRALTSASSNASASAGDRPAPSGSSRSRCVGLVAGVAACRPGSVVRRARSWARARRGAPWVDDGRRAPAAVDREGLDGSGDDRRGGDRQGLDRFGPDHCRRVDGQRLHRVRPSRRTRHGRGSDGERVARVTGHGPARVRFGQTGSGSVRVTFGFGAGTRAGDGGRVHAGRRHGGRGGGVAGSSGV